MGDFADDPDVTSRESDQGWAYNRREGKLCPVCLDVIADRSTTCRRCVWEWNAIKGNPTRLAWWIVYAASVRELRGVKVWERDKET